MVYAGVSGGQYLVTTKQNQSNGYPWGCHSSVTGATSAADGYANSAAILTSSCPSYPDRAAALCAALGPGWALPAKNQLQVLYNNRLAIGGFSAGYYWSSTEFDNYNVWALPFGSGTFGNGYWKSNNTGITRCVRSFE